MTTLESRRCANCGTTITDGHGRARNRQAWCASRACLLAAKRQRSSKYYATPKGQRAIMARKLRGIAA